MSYVLLYLFQNMNFKFPASFLVFTLVLSIYDWFIEGSPGYRARISRRHYGAINVCKMALAVGRENLGHLKRPKEICSRLSILIATHLNLEFVDRHESKLQV